MCGDIGGGAPGCAGRDPVVGDEFDQYLGGLGALCLIKLSPNLRQCSPGDEESNGPLGGSGR